MSATGKTDFSGKEYSFAVRVEGNGDPYDATVDQYLAEMAGSPTTASAIRFQAKADPDDPSRLLLYGNGLVTNPVAA